MKKRWKLYGCFMGMIAAGAALGDHWEALEEITLVIATVISAVCYALAGWVEKWK